MLSDPRSEIIGAFGVLDRTIAPGSPGYGIARPIIFAIDADGVIRHRFSKSDYTIRPDIDSVLETLRKDAGS